MKNYLLTAVFVMLAACTTGTGKTSKALVCVGYCSVKGSESEFAVVESEALVKSNENIEKLLEEVLDPDEEESDE